MTRAKVMVTDIPAISLEDRKLLDALGSPKPHKSAYSSYSKMTGLKLNFSGTNRQEPSSAKTLKRHEPLWMVIQDEANQKLEANLRVAISEEAKEDDLIEYCPEEAATTGDFTSNKTEKKKVTQEITLSYHASIHMELFEALYSKRCRSLIGWFKIRKVELIGPDLMHQAIEKLKIIKEWLKTAYIRQKSYLDVCRMNLEVKEDDWVFLNVSPMKGIMQFGKKGKLSLRYAEPYKIIQRIGHPVFHVSILKKVIGDPTLIVLVETIEVEEGTWEAKEEMKKKYPHLFE
ncbi:uncharacterized protein [Nicotiana sylvestris]|uniref:uncharacterized protein n=1 Tax=Nicotiana sylvestris TaxID=4096 RepID=UPI00388C6C2C